jgi:hypothetical protein
MDFAKKNIELHNRNLLCLILFWSTTVRFEQQIKHSGSSERQKTKLD